MRSIENSLDQPDIGDFLEPTEADIEMLDESTQTYFDRGDRTVSTTHRLLDYGSDIAETRTIYQAFDITDRHERAESQRQGILLNWQHREAIYFGYDPATGAVEYRLPDEAGVKHLADLWDEEAQELLWKLTEPMRGGTGLAGQQVSSSETRRRLGLKSDPTVITIYRGRLYDTFMGADLMELAEQATSDSYSQTTIEENSRQLSNRLFVEGHRTAKVPNYGDPNDPNQDWKGVVKYCDDEFQFVLQIGATEEPYRFQIANTPPEAMPLRTMRNGNLVNPPFESKYWLDISATGSHQLTKRGTDLINAKLFALSLEGLNF